MNYYIMKEKKMKDLISVIVPVYNVVDYLPKCLDSILNQTYKELEIVLIDDGSFDGSSEVCDQYAKNDNRIKVIHQKNAGVAEARNVGLDNSCGKYIIFVDSDDFINCDLVIFLLNDIKEKKADISICGYYKIFEDGSKKTCYHLNENFIVKGNDKFKYLYNSYSVITISPCLKIYKKELFANLRYKKGKNHEDEIISLDILKKAAVISYNIKPLYNYVKREKSITYRFNMKMFDSLDAYELRKKYFKKKKYDNLYDLNEYFKFCILTNALIMYDISNSNELSACEYKKLIDECIILSNYLIKSNYISFTIKGKLMLFLVSKKVYFSFFKKRRMKV